MSSWPFAGTVRVNRAVRSGVVISSDFQDASIVLSVSETFVTTSSVEKRPVSTIAGTTSAPRATESSWSVTAGTKEPSPVPLSLTIPYATKRALPETRSMRA